MTVDSMEYWSDQLAGHAESTRRHYVGFFKRFSERMGKTPDELIELQRIALEPVGDPRENRVLENMVIAWIRELENEGYSINTQKLAYTGVLSFFQANLFPLRMRPQDRPSGEGSGSRIPEKEEICRMLGAAKSRIYRGAIMLLKDSGLRISDAVQLRWDDAHDYGEGFWGWKIQTKKRKIQATPFIGPEATEALEMLDRKDQRLLPICAKTLSNAISLITTEAGLTDVTAHGLRKFFNVELQAARIPKEWRYQMMGKKTGAYDEKRIRKLFEAYREAYSHLKVHGAFSVEFEKLRDNLEKLRKENKVLRDKLNDITSTPLLEDMVSLLQLPGGREFFSSLVDDAKRKLDEMFKLRGH